MTLPVDPDEPLPVLLPNPELAPVEPREPDEPGDPLEVETAGADEPELLEVVPAVLEDPGLFVEPAVAVDAGVGDPDADVVVVGATAEVEAVGAGALELLEVVPAVLEDPGLFVEPAVAVEDGVGDPDADVVVVGATAEVEAVGAGALELLEVAPAVLEDPGLFVEPAVAVDAVVGVPDADVVPIGVPVLVLDWLDPAPLAVFDPAPVAVDVLGNGVLELLEVGPAITVPGEPPLDVVFDLPVLPAAATEAIAET